MDNVECLGIIASILTTVAYIPQAYKILITKNTDSFSIYTFTILMLGLMLWLAYGYFISDFPLILSNCLALIFVFIIWFMKVKNILKL